MEMEAIRVPRTISQPPPISHPGPPPLPAWCAHCGQVIKPASGQVMKPAPGIDWKEAGTFLVKVLTVVAAIVVVIACFSIVAGLLSQRSRRD